MYYLYPIIIIPFCSFPSETPILSGVEGGILSRFRLLSESVDNYHVEPLYFDWGV
jgi:hypothetical protein